MKPINYLHIAIFAISILSLASMHSNAAVVTNTNDSGPGSLREAVVYGGNVTFSPSLIASGSATIVLNSAISITTPFMTITGLYNDTDTLYISGNNSTQIFNIGFSGTSNSSWFTTLNNLVFINGNSAGAYGGAVRCVSGSLEINDCVFINNTARWGGAVGFWEYNASYNYSLTVSNSTFYDNSATSNGGAIYCRDYLSEPNYATTTVNNSTFSGNHATSGGSAIASSCGSSSTASTGTANSRISVYQSTISNNTGSSAIWNSGSASNSSWNHANCKTYIYNSTIVDNGTNWVYSDADGTSFVYVRSSILSNSLFNNPSSPSNTINSLGYNIFTSSSVNGSSGTDQLGVWIGSIGLGPLEFNGGGTKTRMPMIGSPAINNGNPSDAVNAQNAPIIGVRDVGAAELTTTYGTDIITACNSHTWIDGITYFADNFSATDTLVNSNGHDSIVTLNLHINPIYTELAVDTICNGDTYLFGGQTLTVAGSYSETFSSVNGCDSIVNLTLEVINPSLSTDVISSCGTYVWIDGNTYNSSTNSPTWTLTNNNGCDSVVTLNLTIGDFASPTPDLGLLPDLVNQCAISSLTIPTATDNCAGTITGTHNASFPITSNTTITWTYDDGNGNTSTQTQNVVINDVTAPVADVGSLANVTDQCEVTSLTAPTATDNCAGMITGTHNTSFPITSSTTITWTFDDGNGNTSTQTQNMVINDVTAPVADVSSLANVTAQCEVTSLTAPMATDNCAGAITGTHNASFPITTNTTVTWTYNDGNGNTSTQTQNVVINDVTAPVPNTANLADVNDQCAVSSLTAPTATDNCAGTLTGTHNAQFPINSSATITWTFDDGHGNTSTQTQNVVIIDFTAPVPDAATLADVINQCEVPFLTAPTATDNCAGTVIGTHNATLPISSSVVVTWTFADGNGNISTQSQNVIINDITAPVPTVANLSALSDECEINSLTAPTANDNCEGAITGTHDATLPITSSNTITWTYDDGNGNTATQTQNVVITPIENSVTQVDGVTLMADANGYSYQWVDCNNDNAAVQGEMAQSFTAISNGSYAVEIGNGNCSVTSNCIQILTVGVDEVVSDSKVYASLGQLTIILQENVQRGQLTMLDVSGRSILTANLNRNRTMLETNVAIGVYLIRIETENGINTHKVILD